jgi:hypothetical protein
MLRSSIVFVPILCFLLAATAYAQPAPMEWGRVAPEDLAIRSFPDTNAAAVILGHVGSVVIDRNYDLTFQRHTRVKILN